MSLSQKAVTYTKVKSIRNGRGLDYYHIDFTQSYGVFVYDRKKEVLYDAYVKRDGGADETDFDANVAPVSMLCADYNELFRDAPNISDIISEEIMVRITGTNIPTAYNSSYQLTTTANRNHVEVRNDTDKVILISFHGTNDNRKLLAGEAGVWDNVDVSKNSTIRVRHDGTAPTNGEVTIAAWSDGEV